MAEIDKISLEEARKELESYNNIKIYFDAIKKGTRKARTENMSDDECKALTDEISIEIARLSENLVIIKRTLMDKMQRLEAPYNMILYYKYISCLSIESIAETAVYSMEYVRRLVRKGISLYSALP